MTQSKDLKNIFSRHIAKTLDLLEISRSDERLVRVVKTQLWELYDEITQGKEKLNAEQDNKSIY